MCVFPQQTVMFKIIFKTKTIPLAMSLSFRAQFPERIHLLICPLFHLLFTPQSLAIWFLPYCFSVLLRTLTQVSFPVDTIQALRPFLWMSLLFWVSEIPLSPISYWFSTSSTGLYSSSVKDGCPQGASLGPILLSWILPGYLTCAQVFPSAYPPVIPRGYVGGEALSLDLLV